MNEDETGGAGALNTAVDGTADATGALGVLDVAAIRRKQAAVQKSAADQAAFYDRMEKELLARRMGPTLSEKLLQMSAALIQPTQVRGFAGSMANLMPVLQKQAQQRREGEISRADALQKLRRDQLAGKQDLLEKELDTEVSLARINAAAAKAGQPKMTYAEGEWRIQPGTGGVPPLNAKGQYVVSGQEQAASVPKGRQFVLAGDPSGKVYYGQ